MPTQRGVAIPLVILIIAAVIVTGGILFFRSNSQTVQTSSPTPLPSVADEEVLPAGREVNITASFTIVTDTITRSFTSPKYHNQSPDVYIQASDPATIHVKKKGTTWDDFFKTLPMKLTKECLITGDGETLCDGKGSSLKFYLNDVEDKDLLEREIKEDDRVLIKFTSPAVY